MPPVSENVDANELAAIKTQVMDTELEDDLGEYGSYVDKLEAEENDGGEDSDTSAETELESEDDESLEEESEGEIDDEEPEDGKGDTDDAEEEVQEDEEDEPAPEDTLANPDENPVVPRERLNAANRKRQEEADRANQLERELAQMKAQMESAAETAGVDNINPSILKEAAEKALDGDTDAFANMLAEQFNAQNERLTVRQEKIRETAKQEALAEFRAEQLNKERSDSAAKWEAKYPELDASNPNVNAEALEEAVALADMFEARGYTPSVALEKAVTAVSVNFKLEEAGAEPSSVVTKEPTEKKPVVTKRAAKKPPKQPPATGEGTGLDSGTRKYDPAKMSQDEWDALPQSVRDQILDI